MKLIHSYLAEQQYAEIQRLAKESGLSFAELLRRLLDEALAQRKDRQQS